MGAQIKPSPGTGSYCFRILRQIYHMVSPLYAGGEHKAGYGQLYVHFFFSEATNQRMINKEGCSQILMRQLDSIIREVNPFAESFIKMQEIVENNPEKSVKMVFMEGGSLNLRRYNALTTRTEIAAIFFGDDGEPPANLNIIIYPVGSSCKIISPFNQCADPMVYLLLFPGGDFGWNSSLENVEERRTTRRTRGTQLQFYAYGFSLLRANGKLFQQYNVDTYLKTEGNFGCYQ